jgi:hypothetical protein
VIVGAVATGTVLTGDGVSGGGVTDAVVIGVWFAVDAGTEADL